MYSCPASVFRAFGYPRSFFLSLSLALALARSLSLSLSLSLLEHFPTFSTPPFLSLSHHTPLAPARDVTLLLTYSPTHIYIYTHTVTLPDTDDLCVAVCCSVLQCLAIRCNVLQCVAVCCSVLQYVAMCCSVLQCVAVCCSVLQCVCGVCTSIHT